ncbi:class IV adenylate cyclase [Methanonatronarchaeum sp. AMET6-2]|uniref:class IV adenylate cyclase n=1 Tax=Methanonatronarchaeum sp. AMET6-2 TaxID=2933293 RepID=UPI00121EEF9C|nr:class IV adenylate cyclase [Methanonatronarchaeum sp. AMET6-2]RZN61912.1 MAG: class IV adenylate cyclase [Methanonatronarchaeia archaeon]UOY10642.1 class IV adenylate cyclase [Methanonatronarchaeum sp. AMET6-2]
MSKEIEVEIKAKVDSREELEQKILENGSYIDTYHQKDIYFNHPCRDFSETDEALRIREHNKNAYITYKGSKMDETSKSREEIETPIKNIDKHIKILRKLGFKPLKPVQKKRDKYKVGKHTIVIDEVKGLGTYIEVETQSNQKNYQKDLEETKKLISKLGFNEKNLIRRSYLELLLEKNE